MENKKTKLLFESWRAFIKEADASGEKPSLKAASALDQTLKQKDYMAFVNKLKELAGNEEFQKALNYGQKDGKPDDEKIALVEMSPKVTQLKPTQNEIDMKGSLKFAVASVDNLLKLLENGEKSPGKGGPVSGGAIVTGAGGKLVLDGHHRWSQVYCINPDATIKAIDLQIPGAAPMDYLKIMQLAIAANLKDVPVQSVQGTNLLDQAITKEQLSTWMNQNTPKEVLTEAANKETKLFKAIVGKLQSSGGKIENNENPLIMLVWNNILKLRKTGQPVEGAPKRDFMPQTDDATNWKTIAANGQLNFKDPTSGIAEAKIKQIVREEIKKLKK